MSNKISEERRNYNRQYYHDVIKKKRTEQLKATIGASGDPGLCCYCGVQMSFVPGTIHNRKPTDRTEDHLVPRSKDGKGKGENKVFCCRGCNQSKGNRSIEEWRRLLQAKTSGARFTPAQIAWLNDRGFDYWAVVVSENPHRFWFEN